MYEGRWGRRVYGRIQKGPKYTRFYLSIAITNGLIVQRVAMVPNNELESFSGLYKFTLDKMVRELEAQYNRRIYTP